MRDDYTTNYHFLIIHLSFERLGECIFRTLMGVEELDVVLGMNQLDSLPVIVYVAKA